MATHGNGKIFISYSHDDEERCQPLLNALADWGVDYWFDNERMEAGNDLSEHIQQAIQERDIFIRVDSLAVQAKPYWVDMETNAFRALQAKDENAGQHGKRTLIIIVLDSGYALQPFERTLIRIDAFKMKQQEWLTKLHRALHGWVMEEPKTTRQHTIWQRIWQFIERAAIVLGGIAALVAILTFIGIGLVHGVNGGGTPTPTATPSSTPTHTPTPTPSPTPTPTHTPSSQPPKTYPETTGGDAHTWTNYMNAGGTEGPTIAGRQTVQIACKVTGFRVADGNTWWYRIAESPWDNRYYVSADAFYNNGQTSGPLSSGPFVDSAVPDC